MKTAVKKNWTVTVNVFSGRPDPEWVLRSAQQKKWMQLWETAAVMEPSQVPVSRLGYTGCRLQYNEHSHWHLYNGCVSFYDKKGVQSKKDTDRKMEIFLLNSAPVETKAMLRSLQLI